MSSQSHVFSELYSGYRHWGVNEKKSDLKFFKIFVLQVQLLNTDISRKFNSFLIELFNLHDRYPEIQEKR